MKVIQGEFGENITLDYVKQMVETGEELYLNSAGGSLFEGLAIYDYFKAVNFESIVLSGFVASAATIAMLGVKNRIATPNARFLIHNPWNMAIGDGATLQKQAVELTSEQNNILDIYESVLNLSRSEIQSLMNEEKTLTAQEALQIGLITNIKTNENMQVDTKTTEQMGVFASLLGEIKAMLSPKNTPKNLNIQDINGIDIDFPETESIDTLKVGDPVKVNGVAATGEYTLGSGTMITAKNGIVTEIQLPSNDSAELTAANEALTAAKTEIENLKAEIVKAASEKTILAEKFTTIEAKYTEIMNLSSKGQINNGSTPEPDPQKQKSTFSYKSK